MKPQMNQLLIFPRNATVLQIADLIFRDLDFLQGFLKDAQWHRWINKFSWSADPENGEDAVVMLELWFDLCHEKPFVIKVTFRRGAANEWEAYFAEVTSADGKTVHYDYDIGLLNVTYFLSNCVQNFDADFPYVPKAGAQ